MPEQAKYFIVDDDASFRSTLIEYMHQAGHVLVGEAGDTATAYALLAELSELDVALLDGNINWDNDESGADGAGLAQFIREHFPHAVIICISMKTYSWATVRGINANSGSAAIAEAVTVA